MNINQNQTIFYNLPKEHKKSYKSYSRQNKDHSNSKFYDEINLQEFNDENKPFNSVLLPTLTGPNIAILILFFNSI